MGIGITEPHSAFKGALAAFFIIRGYMDKREALKSSREAIEVLKRIECPKEWRETFYRNITFLERVVESIEDRKRLNRETDSVQVATGG